LFGKIHRPVAEVLIQSKSGKWYPLFMYVDSGADISLIPRQVGESLGLDFDKSKIQEVKGIGERAVPVVISYVRLKIGKKEFDSKIAVSLIEEVPLILGRTDVFDEFLVTFDQKNKIVAFISKDG
jgi:predicted aspartyl protease